MRLPFGLDLMSVLVTLAFVFFVLPWIMGMVARRSGQQDKS